MTSAVTGDGCKELTLALDEAVPHVQKKKVGWESKKLSSATTGIDGTGKKIAKSKASSAAKSSAKTGSKAAGAKTARSKKKA